MQEPLNAIDRRILRLLQSNATLSTAQIAEKVELSQSPCWRRIYRLQQDGFIQRTVALLNPQRLGLNVTVMVDIKLSDHGRDHLAGFEQAVISYPQVLECYSIAGVADYCLKVVTKDLPAYERFLREKLLQLHHVQEAHSHITLSEIKRTTELPLE